MPDRPPAPIAALGAAALIAAAAAGAGVFTWFVSSPLIPLAYTDRPVEYLFLGATPWAAIAVAVAIALLVGLAHARLIPAGPEGRWSPRALAYLVPVTLLGCAPLGGAIVLAGGDRRLAPLTYVLVDLRWWWAVALMGAAIARFDHRRGGVWRTAASRTVGRWTPRGRLMALDGALFLLLLVIAIASSPILRFTAELHGDEPKYLRLAENLYQGLGLDVAHQHQMAELTLAYSPPVWRNAVLFGQALREDAAYLAADARTLLTRGLAFQFNRAQFVEGWFVTGRNGGFYQVHNPGLSLILFPAYFVDRHFIATDAGYQGVFPTALPVTNLVFLLIWSVWGVVLFRFLRAAFERDLLAWLLAAAAMLTMPVAAFPFQIYPETTAGVIVTSACGWLLFGRPDQGRMRAAVVAGAAVGFLPWLHVRFLVTSLVLAGSAMVMLRRRRMPFAMGYALLCAGICLYTYHITGSLRPDAMYESEGSAAPWRLADALQSMMAYPFDRIWGFLPHAPVYLLAIPGWVVLARVQRRTAALLAMLIASLVLAASGHGFTGAGATPLRFLVAVVPLAMVPLGWTLIAWGRSRAVRAAFALLLVISVDAALSYNTHHRKEVGRMIDWAVSGWTPNLLFPWTHGQPWAHWPGTFVLLLAWVAVVSAVFLLPLLVRRWWRTPLAAAVAAPATPLSIPVLALATAAFVAISTTATALGGEWTRTDYWPPLRESRLEAITAGSAMTRCGACYSSSRGAIGRSNLVEDTDQTFSFLPVADDVRVGEPAVILVNAGARDGPGYGSLSLDFGDGSTTRLDVVGQTELRHAYAGAGLQRVSARFSTHGVPPQLRKAEIAVRPGEIDMARVEGLPPGVAGAPVRANIRSLMLGVDGVSVTLSDRSQVATLWLIVWNGTGWRARPADQAASSVSGWVGVVAAGPAGEWRSAPVTVRWPSRALYLGAPAVVFP